MDIQTRIKHAVEKVRNAELEVETILRKEWPINSEIFCILKHGQINPSRMIVMDHDGQGYVRAYMHSTKARFGRFVKDVYYTDIVS